MFKILQYPIPLTILVLFFLTFFGTVNIPNTIRLILILPFVFIGIKRKYHFKRVIIWLLSGLIMSMISSFIFRGQDFLSSFKASPVILMILFYFLICYIHPTVRNTEKSIAYLVLIFDVIYIFQYLLYQKGIVFLPMNEDILRSEGEDVRFRMIGSGLSSLGIFLGATKYMVLKEKKWLAIMCLSLIVILLMAFRTMIAFSVLFLFFLVLKIKGFKRESLCIFAGAAIIAFLLLQIPVIYDKVGYMWDKQFGENAETLSNKDYIRNVTLYYYLFDYFKSPVEYFFGTGLSIPGTSQYKTFEYLGSMGIIYLDWGLLGLSWMIGVIPVLCMIIYSVRSFQLKVNPQYYYVGFWFLYLIVSSITTAEFFREGNFVVQAICLYMVEMTHKQYQYENRNTYIS